MHIEDPNKLRANSRVCPVAGSGRNFDAFVDPYLTEPYDFWLRARQEKSVFYRLELDFRENRWEFVYCTIYAICQA